MEAVFGPMPCLTVTCTLHSAIWTQTDLETSHSEIDNAIIQALSKVLFASVKELAQSLCCAPTTAYRHRAESFHFAFNHLLYGTIYPSEFWNNETASKKIGYF
jgi:hypothetical protein